MKKILSLLLTLCLLLGVLPSQALAYVGDIISPGSTNVQTSTNNNSLVLQNDYIRVTLNRQTGILTTAPTAASDSPGQQKPYCEFITYDNGIGYNKKEITDPATLSLKSASFVEKTPNGDTKAISGDINLCVTGRLVIVPGREGQGVNIQVVEHILDGNLTAELLEHKHLLPVVAFKGNAL